MSGKQRAAKGEPFVMFTRELLASDAWRSAGINARRLIDFLALEHMRHAGKENGRLKAPKHQLAIFGIGERRVIAAIHEAEDLGLIDCLRGGMRVANQYTLTWLPLHNGNEPSHRWRAFRNPNLAPIPTPKSKNLGDKGTPALGDKGTPDRPNLGDKGTPDRPQNLGDKCHHPSRSSYQEGANILGVTGRAARPEPVGNGHALAEEKALGSVDWRAPGVRRVAGLGTE